MDPNVLTAIVLIGLGLLFVLVELLIGTDGSLLILAVVCWLGASWFAWEGWANQWGWDWWAYALAVCVGIPAAAGGALAVLPGSPAGRKLFPVPDPEEVRPYSEEADLWRESLIGARGTSLNLMNPGGLILVEGERHHAESEGLPIDPDQIVEIIDVRSNRFIVKPASDPAAKLPGQSEPEDLVY